ncbi:MAG: YraN family protein, partial [Proteobacteria bacterium]
ADGAWAEQRAQKHLERHGLTLIERNFASRFGEIDLIMRDRATLVFVEVRLRRNLDFGHPAETVTHAKRARIRRTAAYYLKHRRGGAAPDCRFDVVAIVGGRERSSTERLRDAFY